MLVLRSTLLLLGIVHVLFSLYAQPNIEWQATLGGSEEELAYDVEQCPDGGYIVVGSSRSNDGDVSENFDSQNFWVVKLTVNGEIDWESTYGGNDFEIARDVLPTIDGGYVLIGLTTSNDGQVTGLKGYSDYWVLKLSANGDVEWEKTLGGTGSEYGYAIEQTSDGGYYVAGGSQSDNGDVSGNYGGVDYWVVRLSPTGDIIWENHFGGSRDDLAFSLDKTTDGGCIVAGRTRSSDGDVSGFHGGANFTFDCWVVKLSVEGEIDWERSLGGTDNDEGYTIRQTSDGNYVVAGLTRSMDGDVQDNPLGLDLWVVKLDAEGEIIWQKLFGGFSKDIAGAIRETADGGYIVTGCTGPAGDKRFWTIKLTAEGELDWEKTYGGTEDDRSFSVNQTVDGGFIVAGRTASDNGDVSGQHGDYDYWVVKLGACAVNTELLLMDESLQSLEVALSSTYQWIDCSDGSLIEGATSSNFAPELGGDYAVIVQNGTCVDTSNCVTLCPIDDSIDFMDNSRLVATSNSPTATYQWINCEDESPIKGATESSFEPTSSGRYAVVISDGNCSVTSLCYIVCLEELDATIFLNEDGNLESVEDTLNTTFQWYYCINGGLIEGATAPIYTPTESGKYTVIIQRGVCSATALCFTYCAVDISTSVSGNTIYAAADPASSSYQWINCEDGSVIPNETSPVFMADRTGDYAVIVRQGTCVDTSQCLRACVVNTELTLTQDSIQAPQDSLITSYQWIDCNSETIIDGENDASFTPATTGQYAAIISQGVCIDTSDCVTFCAISTDLVVDGNTIYSLADTTISSYQWFNCATGSLFQEAQDYFFTPSANGTYGVIVTQGVCLTNSDCVEYTIVGVKEQPVLEIHLFPNPTHDLLLLEAPSSWHGLPYQIYAIDGRIVHSGLVSTPITEINLRGLAAGIYVIEIMISGSIVRDKVIKQ